MNLFARDHMNTALALGTCVLAVVLALAVMVRP
jgi:hypothetical protein